MVSGVRASFPDGHFTVEEVLAEGDAVAQRWTFRATHQGEFMGMAGTGRKVEVCGMAISHVKDGKMVDHTADWDALGMLKQVGAA